MRPHAHFNLVCLAIIGFCIGGMLYLWQEQVLAVFVSPAVVEVPESISRSEVEKKKFEVPKTQEQPEPVKVPEESEVPEVFPTSSEAEVDTEPEEDDVSVATLPDSINLDVPFTSQAPEKNWDQPWQDACEEAAALMIDAYLKDYSLSVLFAKDEIIKMVAWEEEKNWGRSIEIERIKALFDDFLKLPQGRTTRIIENPTIEQIKSLVAAGQPVYVVADGKILPNPHFQNGGPEYHALVIRGYTETHFITNDPGTQFGENFKYAYDDLMQSIRDWNGGDVKTGRRVVLVVD